MTSSSAQSLAHRLFDAHDTYQEKSLLHRRFKHADIQPLLDSLGLRSGLEVSEIGQSLEKRAIRQVKAGRGPKRILLWSQMHGNEATATMALFDVFNFLTASGDGFDSLRNTLLRELTLYAVPMLNPDGAQRFQRYTASGIDMNRDALRLQTPEGALLKHLQQTLQPLVGFNLHDQNPLYSVGHTGKQAVVTFLATAYDEARNLNDVRKRSMQLIVGMNRVLQSFIPGQVARYDDAFEPRAFGDNIQKWGTTLVLIESGGYYGDSEKLHIRKLNFIALLTALEAIATDTYSQESIGEYARIPENGPHLFDVLIRNANLRQNGRSVRVDIGINRNEVNTDSARHFFYKSSIEEIGDLSGFYGLEEIDATGLTLTPARVYAKPIRSVSQLRRLNLDSLRQQGVLGFRVAQAKKDSALAEPVHVLQAGSLPARPLKREQIPTFLLKDGTRIRYWFVNGFWTSDADTAGILGNGIVD